MGDAKKHWNTIYSTKTPEEVAWTQDIPKPSLDLLNYFKPPKTASIIDIGGGDSKFVEYMIAMGFQNITVLDISERALERAQARLGENSKKVKWIVSDVLDFKADQDFDLWHDRATFHFLTAESEIEKYLSIARNAIRNNGFLTIGTFSEKGPDQCSGLKIKKYSEESLRHQLEQGFIKLRCFTEDHVTPFKTTQNFLFCGFQRKSV